MRLQIIIMLFRRTLSLFRHGFSVEKFSELLEANDLQSLQQAATMMISLQSQQSHLKKKINQYQARLKSYKESNKTQKIKELINYVSEQENQNKLVLERCKRQLQIANKYSITRIAKQLVEVADNLKKCTQELQKTEGGRNKELDEAQSMLKQTFQKFNICEFNPIGEKYNPNTSQAVLQMAGDSEQDGIVGITNQTGYMIYQRVLRSAKVGVYKSK